MMKCRVLLVSLTLVLTGLADEVVTKNVPIPVTEPAKIEAQLGNKATIRGKVTRTGQSKGGFQFLNFANAQFVVVCFPDAVAKFTSGNPVDLYKDKTIDITGKIEKYRDKFQIKLESPDQINVVKAGSTAAASDTAKSEAATAKKKAKTKAGDAAKAKKKPVDPKKFFDC